MTLREALQSIYDQHGRLTPALVVQVAKKRKGEAGKMLHDRLDWDDASAASQWRMTQAAELIRSVRVVYKEADETSPEKSVRAFHALRRDGEDGYEPVELIVTDPFATKLLLQQMEREWKALHRKWHDFPEFIALIEGAVEDTAA